MFQIDGFDYVPILYPFNQCNAVRIDENNHTIDEYVRYINKNHIEQAEIVLADLHFLSACPSLKYLKIHSPRASDVIDFSPLYQHPEIKYLHCINTFCLTEGKPMEHVNLIDYSKVSGLEFLTATATPASKNYQVVKTLKSLSIGGYRSKSGNLSELFCSKVLDTLSLRECRETSLDGIENSDKLQCLYISYNRMLQDISALRKVKGSLRALRIINCPKVEDFSVLSELDNLELLEISGRNNLPDLKFINQMNKLKTFVFDVPIVDGDLSCCLGLSYAHCGKIKKNYNVAEKALPKGEYFRGNDTVDIWRRLE